MDEYFEALANIHRRRLLVALLDHNPQQEPISVPEDVHEGETEVEVLQAKFYHSHLSRLEKAGLIRWNMDAHEVVKGAKFDEIRPLLELLQDRGGELPDGSL